MDVGSKRRPEVGGVVDSGFEEWQAGKCPLLK